VPDAILSNSDQLVGFLVVGRTVGTLVNGTCVLEALSLGWELNRLFAALNHSRLITWWWLLEIQCCA
jgi:hypothetical protein